MSKPLDSRPPLEATRTLTAMHGSLPLPVTAIVLTFNEAANIRACVEALNFVEDVVIVDSGSTDETVQLASAARGDVRIFEHRFKDFGDQRNWALDNASPRHSWILFIDADEFCTPQLAREIAEFIAEPGDNVGAYVAGKNYFLGRWLKHATMYPSYQLRLLKYGEVRYRKEGHGQKEVTDGPLYYLKQGWRHDGFSKGLHQWIGRHNAYSTDEVDLILRLRNEPLSIREAFSTDPIIRRRATKKLGAKLPLRPLTRFIYSYFWRRGFLDGYPGLLYCLLRVAHDIHIVAKIAERERSRRGPNTDGCQSTL